MFDFNAGLLYLIAVGGWFLLRLVRTVRYGRPYFWRELFLNLFFLYLCYLFFVAFEPFVVPLDVSGRQINWLPLRGIVTMIERSNQVNQPLTSRIVWINLIGNILLFVPIGFLPATLWERCRKVSMAMAFGLGVSLLIEISQYFLAVRVVDVDDLILNGLGTLVGFGVFSLLRLVRPIRHWQDALSQAERPRAPLAAWVYLLLVLAAFILIYTQQRSAALLQQGSLPARPPAISLMSLGALARPHIAKPRVLFF